MFGFGASGGFGGAAATFDPSAFASAPKAAAADEGDDAADAAAVPRILLEQRAERGAAILLDVPEGGWRLSGARLPTGLQPGSRARTWLAAISPTCSGVISSENLSCSHKPLLLLLTCR